VNAVPGLNHEGTDALGFAVAGRVAGGAARERGELAKVDLCKECGLDV
jgi:hypothetical protein